jgi:hypothetical protein
MRTDMNNSTCPTCQATALTRNHYFTGKLMVERDFTDEQRYFRERLRLHNQRLHGSGVACGLAVTQHANPTCQDRYVVLQPGGAVDCCGNDILVTLADTVDLHAFPAFKALVDEPDGEDHVVQISICYRECPTEEIPVLYDECGCDDSQCAPNRILESYALDVVIDPPEAPNEFDAASLTRTNTLNYNFTRGVAIDETNGRIFLLTTTHVHMIDATTKAWMAAASLTRPGLAMAIVPDGSRLNVIVGPTGAETDSRLLSFDVSGSAFGAPTETVLTGSGNATPAVAVNLNGDFLVGFPNGQLWVWLFSAATPINVALSAGLSSIVASSDGIRAWVAFGTNTLKLLDLTAADLDPTDWSVDGTVHLDTLALVATTAPDKLVAGDRTDSALYILDPDLPDASPPLASAALSDDPVAIAVAPGGSWAYVAEANDSIEILDLERMLLLLPVTPPPLVPVGLGTLGVSITASGQTLYAPFAGASDGTSSGVAIFDVTNVDCGAALHEVRPCPDCSQADCLVLATIKGWQPGRRLLDPADPAPPADEDSDNDIARIDNLDGRKILASTETLQEVIECILARGINGIVGEQGPPGEPGAQGPQGLKGDTGDTGDTGPAGADGAPGANGAPGADGADGAGLTDGLTRIVGLSWRHGADDHELMEVTVTSGTGATETFDAIVIGCSDRVRLIPSTGLPGNPNWNNIFKVEVLHDVGDPVPGLKCRCQALGVFMPVDFTLSGEEITSATVPSPLEWANGIAYLFTRETVERLNDGDEIHVTLLGDLVLDERGNALAANFIRGRLPSGDIRVSTTTPPSFPGSDDPPLMLGLPGGRFESWFYYRARRS